jgi:hypothetical protein
MEPLLPPLGLKGTFKLNQPLDSILNPNIVYTVFGIESINKMLTDGIDVKTIIYINQGLSLEDYTVDLENNIPIVTLTTEAKQLFYIPSRFIANMPEATGVIYKQKAILINVGYLKDDLDIEFIKEDVNDLVSSMIGTKCESSIEDLSGGYLLSYEDSDVKEKDRIKNITNKITCNAKLSKCYETLNYYKVKINKLLEKLNIV